MSRTKPTRATVDIWNGRPTAELLPTGVAAGSYGSATAISTFTVDANGRLTAAGSVAPQLTLTATYFSSLNGAAITSLTPANISAGIAGIDITGNAATASVAAVANSAAKWTTPRLLAGNSVDGSAAVVFANKLIVQGTVDAGLSAAQFLGALATGIVKNTTTTGVLSIAVAADFPTLNQSTTGNAATATALLNARTIAGVSFDGSANIAIPSTGLSDSALLARLASPAFSGTPTAPTAAPGTNTTQLASTAFVAAAVSGAAVTSITGTAGQIVASAATGAVTLSAGANVMLLNGGQTVTSAVWNAGAVTSSGNILGATTVRAAGFSAPASGAGAEIFFNASEGTLVSYDRGASLYRATNIDGLNLNFKISGTTQMALHASGCLSLGNATDTGAPDLVVGNGSTVSLAFLVNGAFGNGSAGARIELRENTSGGGAPGVVWLFDKAATGRFLWSDSAGLLRINVGEPTVTAGDTIGTIVGTQVSTLDTKDLLGDDLTPEQALATILATRIRRFKYKSNAYSGTIFHGIIADWSPEFAMDHDAAHPRGRSFNAINAHGYTVQSFKAINARLAALESR